jgi:DNA polymerase III subunit chi
MGEAKFFHLTRSAPEDVVRLNVTRALAMGWRVVIRGRDRAALEALDERLWLTPEDSFLPHGLCGGPHDADQPVLLTDRTAIPNGASALMALDGAEVTAADLAPLQRAWIIFDGGDDKALEIARTQWRSLTAAGVTAEYWSEDSGKWTMKMAKQGGEG